MAKKKSNLPEPTPAQAAAAVPPVRRRERAVEAGYDVAATAANPAQSRAGVVEDLVVNVEGVSLAVIDGARAVLAVGKSATGLLTQADLHALRRVIDQAIQSTY